MIALTHARISTMRAQTNCPVCGAATWVHSGDAVRFTALFKCGAVFDVGAGRPIAHLTPCPAPSVVGAAHLEHLAAKVIDGEGAAALIGGDA